MIITDNTNNTNLIATSNTTIVERPISIRQATAHFRKLFPEPQPGFAILMFLPEGKGAPIHHAIRLDEENRCNTFRNTIQQYSETHNCYISVATYTCDHRMNETTNKREHRTKEMVRECRWAVGERDHHQLSDLLPPPTLILETSAGHYQDFWRLDSGTDVAVIENLNRRIAQACGYGFQAIDAVHLFRIAGTRNFKPERKREIVRVVERTEAAYTLSDFDHLPAVAVTKPVQYLSPDSYERWGAMTDADQILVRRAKNAKNGAKFSRLWGGDITGYVDNDREPDTNRADLAFCCLLAYWTHGNAEQMDRMFCHSGLYRDKWDRDDYRERTIAKAIASWEADDVWDDKEGATDDDCRTSPTVAGDGKVAAFDGDWRPSEPVAVNGVNLKRLSEVTPERIAWLWRGFIPLGKLTVLDGDPGLGKSTVTLDIAARLTRGLPMPDGTVSDLDAPASVVLLTAEDGLADTIVPRLQAAGGYRGSVYAFETIGTGDAERLPSLADYTKLEEIIAAMGAKLVIVDPLMAYLPPTTNAHRDQDIRRVMSPLKQVAERTGAAILVVRHLNKGTSENVLYRGGGSIGIIGAVRSGLIVGQDPSDPTGTRRILAVQKTNIAARAESLSYRIDGNDEDVARIVWLGPSDHTASSLFAPIEDTGGGQVAEAKVFLRDVLSEGPIAANRVKEQAAAAGVKERTLERAKKALGVLSTKQGFGGEFVWSLPDYEDRQPDQRPPTNAEDRQPLDDGEEWQSAAD